MTPVTQADKDRIERFLLQDLTNGLAEEHLWRLVADVRAEERGKNSSAFYHLVALHDDATLWLEHRGDIPSGVKKSLDDAAHFLAANQ